MASTAPSAFPAPAPPVESPVRSRGRSFAGALALLTIVSLSLVIVVACADHASPLTPSSNPYWYPRWLAGPFGAVLPSLTRDGKTLEDIFTFGLLAMYAAYVVAIATVPSLRARWAILAIVAVHVVFLLSPPLSLTDVFNYINYGRMDIVYHLNPYATIPTLEPHSDLAFVLSNWHELQSPYGPLFTLLTFIIVPLGVVGAFWAVKGILMLASFGIILLVWKSARLLGRDPVRAIVFVGLNPVVLVFGLGGDHNDFITIFFVMLGVYLLLRVRHAALDARGEPLDEEERVHVGEGNPPAAAPANGRRAWLPVGLREAFVDARGRAVAGATASGLVASPTGASGPASGTIVGPPPRTTVGGPVTRRRRWPSSGDGAGARGHLWAWVWPLTPLEIAAGAALVVATGLKASAAVIIPVALCALRPAPRRIVQVLIGMAITALLIALASYAAFGAHIPDLSTQTRLVTNESLPNVLGFLLGLGGEGPTMQRVVQLVLVLAVAGACAFAWRRHELLRPAAWATVALLVTLSWVLPWYILWLLPLVALARSKALVRVSLVLGLYLLVVWVPIAGSWYRDIGFSPGSTKLGQQHAYEVKQLLDY